MKLSFFTKCHMQQKRLHYELYCIDYMMCIRDNSILCFVFGYNVLSFEYLRRRDAPQRRLDNRLAIVTWSLSSYLIRQLHGFIQILPSLCTPIS